MAQQGESGGKQRGLRAQAGKYLTFKLGGGDYGIEIIKVVEIIKLMPITQVPRMPDFIRGVINLRGKVIPVMELRRRFGMEHVDDSSNTCIIVVGLKTKNGEVQMGTLVDTVSEVLDVAAADIEPAPAFGGGAGVDTSFILGMAKTKGTVRILLDIDCILNADELDLVSEIPTGAK